MKQFFLIICCSFCIIACEKEKQENSIQGKLFNDCTYTPIGEVEVVLQEKGNQDRNIAADITTANGTFLLSYEMEEDKTGFADLAYFNGTFYEKVLTQIPLNESYQLNVVKNQTSSVVVTLSTTQAHQNDTLIYAVEGSNFVRNRVSPTNGGLDTMIINLPASVTNTENRILYWGMGEADFNVSEAALSDANSNYHHIPLQLSACTTQSATISID